MITPGEEVPDHLKPLTDDPESETIELPGFDECELEHESLDKKPKDTLSKKFIDLIGQGYKPGQAARLVGTSIKGIMGKEAVVKQVRELVENYTLGADIRRQLVRAGMNQLVLENMGPDGDAKIRLDALKAIGADTEVGINAAPQVGIQINVGALQNLFEEEKTDVIEAEYVSLDSRGTAESITDTAQVLDASGIEGLADEAPKDAAIEEGSGTRKDNENGE